MKEPLMITGAFGVGKSAVMREVARERAEELGKIFTEDWSKINDDNYFVLIDIRLSQLDASDIKGLPDLDKENKTAKWYIPDWFPKQGNGILFFDEINLASDIVQSASYQIVNDRELAGHKLPDGYAVVMAGNRGREDGARVNRMQVPLLTRMGHIEIDDNFSGWLDWATENMLEPDIAVFLRNNPQHIWKYEVGSDGRTAICPRLWEKANKFYREYKDKPILKGLLASTLNRAITIELLKFIEIQNKYDIMKIIRGKEKVPEKIDEVYSVMAGIIKKYEENTELLEDILKVEFKPEFKMTMLYLIKSSAVKKEDMDNLKRLILQDIGGYKSAFLELLRGD